MVPTSKVARMQNPHRRRSIGIMIFPALVSSVCALFTGPALRAQGASDWVGMRVVQKTSTIEIRREAVGIPKLPDARSAFDAGAGAPPAGVTASEDRRGAVGIPKLPDVRSPFDMDAPVRRDAAEAGQQTIVSKTTRDLTIYHVAARDGAWLWLVEGNEHFAVGWVRSDGVIPIEQAIEFFTEQIRVNPQNALAFAMRGMLQSDRNQLEAALNDYAHAIKIDPKSTFGYIGRASHLERPERTRQSDWRLHRGHPARSQQRGCLPRTRRRLVRQV